MRFLTVFILTLLPTLMQAEPSLRQFHAQTDAPAATIIAELKRTLPDTVSIATDDHEALMSYTGLHTPPALLSFLTATYPTLATTALSPGAPVVIGVTISADGQITAMINANFPADAYSLTLPKGAELLMDTDLPGDCAKQQIIAQPSDMETAAALYTAHLTSQGFTLENTAPEEVSYFIGRSDDCTAFLYLQPDPGDASATLVVIRLLED